jgi:hypothetical protein
MGVSSLLGVHNAHGFRLLADLWNNYSDIVKHKLLSDAVLLLVHCHQKLFFMDS